MIRPSATGFVVWLVVGLLVALSLAPRAADAQPDPPPEVSQSPPADSAEDVKNAPDPRQATGVAIGESRSQNAWLWIPRALLFIPRWTFWIAVQPIRGGLYAYERYQLAERVKGIFFNDEGTLGAYPLAIFETGFGLNVGGRFVYRDLFGTEGELKLRASYGGRFRQLYSASASTGTLLGDRAELELETAFEIFPKSRFFGYGNPDLVDLDDVMVPLDDLLDPRARQVAVKTRYRHDDIAAELGGVFHATDTIDVRLAARYTHREFGEDPDVPDDEFDIEQIYRTSRLPGYTSDLSNIGLELELTYDSRRGTRFWNSEAAPNSGWKLAGFAGPVRGLDDDPSSYVRYGADLQRLIDIYGATRTLALRLYVEGVTGGISDVPFVDLPRLGGRIFLRGYPRDRFRDRLAALGTVEYSWMVNKFVAAFLFVDTGRVYKSWSDLELDGMRVGYGGGVQFHTATTFRGRVDLSSSIDGDLFLNLSFDPVFDTSSREESP